MKKVLVSTKKALLSPFVWARDRLSHKLGNFSPARIKLFLKKNGLAFVIIFVGWEVIEDVVFPIVFGILGDAVHPAFYAGIPASLALCFHWLAVPILWGIWVKVSGRKDSVDVDCCDD